MGHRIIPFLVVFKNHLPVQSTFGLIRTIDRIK
jgi:hypothetical protein